MNKQQQGPNGGQFRVEPLPDNTKILDPATPTGNVCPARIRIIPMLVQSANRFAMNQAEMVYGIAYETHETTEASAPVCRWCGAVFVIARKIEEGIDVEGTGIREPNATHQG